MWDDVNSVWLITSSTKKFCFDERPLWQPPPGCREVGFSQQTERTLFLIYRLTGMIDWVMRKANCHL